MDKNLSNQIPLYIFLIAACIDVWAIHYDIKSVVYIVKPMLMVSLLWYYIKQANRLDKKYVIALTFSLLGDVFLLGTQELFFIVGLIAFLLAHLFYILIIRKALNPFSLKQFMLSLIPNGILLISLLWFLYPSLGGLKIPVFVYGFVISTFGVFSVLFFLQNRNRQSKFLLLGVYLFILSDSLLAINLFYKPIQFFPEVIMVTYVMAQFLICKFVLNLNQTK
jgi:uncharacterized membrane protein YhhN